MKRILLFGANGQVGQALAAEQLSEGWVLTALSHADCDITVPRDTHKAIQDTKPDIIINAAAMTNVDQCEIETDRAIAINFTAPANLAAQCSVHDIPLIQLSTDFVFDGCGHGGKPYKEDAQLCPLNVYADTKLMGDMAVQQELAWHMILRVSSVFSAFGTNILTRTLGMLAKNDEVKLVSDQIACPTYAPDLAKALLEISEQIVRGKHGAFGVFHYCGEPAASRYDFAQTIMESAAPLTTRRPKIHAALTADFPGGAERPPYSALDCTKIRTVYGISQNLGGRAWTRLSKPYTSKANYPYDDDKGIILAGGSGTRLYPATKAISKQLMPIHDKPMIYYPLTTLITAGINDILIISTPRDLPLFESLLGDGKQWGIKLSYVEQTAPNGLAEAFILGRDFIGTDNVAMILGDNLYHGHELATLLPQVAAKKNGATVFGYRVSEPERYGVVAYGQNGKPIDIVEKPKQPPSHWAVTGLYFYDNQVVEIAKSLKPSPRGELEITDLNRVYLKQNQLDVVQLGRGYAWLDTGTHESLADAGDFVRILEQRQGQKIGCPEEAAFTRGMITGKQVLEISMQMGKTPYAGYLRELVNEERN